MSRLEGNNLLTGCFVQYVPPKWLVFLFCFSRVCLCAHATRCACWEQSDNPLQELQVLLTAKAVCRPTSHLNDLVRNTWNNFN